MLLNRWTKLATQPSLYSAMCLLQLIFNRFLSYLLSILLLLYMKIQFQCHFSFSYEQPLCIACVWKSMDFLASKFLVYVDFVLEEEK